MYPARTTLPGTMPARPAASAIAALTSGRSSRPTGTVESAGGGTVGVLEGSGSEGVSWATEAIRTLPGRSTSPLSASSSPLIAANRLDLPVPLRPTTPTR